MTSSNENGAQNRPHVGLFVTCLVDLFRPNVGFAAVKLLEDAGCTVSVPEMQTCCGQPAYNSGDATNARDIARQVIAAFEQFDYVVGPSGSCMGTIRAHYPEMFPTDAHWRGRADRLAAKSYELMSFLRDVLGVDRLEASYEETVTYHDSCSGLREMGVRAQPRALLGQVGGLTLHEMDESEVCCGFGGTFCVKYPKISERMVADKVQSITESDATTLLGGDLGCLLNMAGRLKREQSRIKVYHAAEVLAGLTDLPPIGDPE
jgi:L-lactate dehydrogenase complex protein LldE